MPNYLAEWPTVTRYVDKTTGKVFVGLGVQGYWCMFDSTNPSRSQMLSPHAYANLGAEYCYPQKLLAERDRLRPAVDDLLHACTQAFEWAKRDGDNADLVYLLASAIAKAKEPA